MFYGITLVILLLDQLSKWWIRTHLQVGGSMEIWKGVLRFTHYENAGIAFSLLQGYGRWFVPVAVLFVLLILYYRRRGMLGGRLGDAAAAFFVAGALGNALDRLLFNQVTDFIAFDSSNGILNLSDYALNIGLILFILDWLISSICSSFSSTSRPSGR
ncbi:signal peptidase II [Paenibacillus sp. JX-17]|uniref:Lipoprotein signal peptidase n=1 Tax=Paenibacillus lacisoli TaxID=3064525 RepID=A0ABT9CAM6_9BACL|nr:signal peptidase II [Paenibacillus sp. JX-17]MDO7905603.1 signal peptidase II [Paenibacillus sp. JX-17]